MHQRAALLISAILMALWSYTATSKLFDLPTFQQALARAPLPHGSAGALAILLPLTELGVAALLFFSRTRLLGLLASFVLLVLFTSYLGWMLLYSPGLPCSCGGVISALSWNEHLIFNGALLLLNAIALFIQSKSIQPLISSPPA